MSDHAVVARDLVLGYPKKVALASSSFEIPSGSVVAVIGPNGSGKSTLLNAIAGLLSPMSGEIERPAGQRRVAYVLQATKVDESLPITVREAVTMGRYASTGAFGRLSVEDRRAVEDAMSRTGVLDLDSRHLSELSGGQRQRVFVAQGLAQDHDLLLLDEPLTGIDLTAAHAIDEVIHEETSRGCTVIMTTHDLSEAQAADYVVLLSGKVIASGPPEQVLTRECLIDAYGPTLIHLEEGRLFVDDPAHTPAAGRHIHRARSIHTEPDPTETHGDDL